jgi:hypothetical protein
MFGLPEEKEEDYLLVVKHLQNFKYFNRIKCYTLSYYPRNRIVEIAEEKNILSETDVMNIEEGIIGDWFHEDLIGASNLKKMRKAFKAFYKLLPLWPSSCIKFIVKHKIYRKFYLIPEYLLVFFQIIIALRKRDYRFEIYFRNYFRHFLKKLRSL